MAGTALLGTVRVAVIADVAKATQGFRGFANTVSKTSSDVIKSIKPVATEVLSYGKQIAAGFADSMERIESIGNAARNLGIDVSDYSRIRYAAEASGVAFAALDSSLAGLQKTLAEGAADGPLKQLGIDIEALKQMGASDQIAEVVKQLNRMGDAAKQQQLGREIFGESFAEFQKMFDSGVAGFEKMIDRSDTMKRTISEDMVDAAKAVNDQIQRMKTNWMDVTTALQVAVAPWVADQLEGMNVIITGIQRQIAAITGESTGGTAFSRTMKNVGYLTQYGGPALQMRASRAAGEFLAGDANGGAITAEERAAFVTRGSASREQTKESTQKKQLDTLGRIEQAVRNPPQSPVVQIP